MENDTTKSKGNKKRKDFVECSITLCATKKQNLWHVDNGFSKHMTRDPNKFIILKRNKKGKVTFGDILSPKIIGKGTVALRNKVKDGNVLLVNNLKPNILSVIQTCDQGHICIFDSKKCEIRRKDSEKIVGTAVRTPSNVYILENEEQFYMSQIDEVLLWHRRMVHLRLDNLIKVNKKGAVRNFPNIIKPPNHVCRHYLHGKKTRTIFKVKEHTTSQPL